MKITVFGAGYVGLVTGACLSEVGHNVLLVEINEERVRELREGKIPIYEPGLSELVLKNVGDDRLSFTTDARQGVEHGDAIFIAVGTPQADDGSANLNMFLSCAKSIAEYSRDGQIIVDKSTVPVGTAREVEAAFVQAGKQVHIVSNPETLREGSAVSDFMNPDRIIIGARAEAAFAAMRDVYSPFLLRNDTQMLEMSPESAELVKYGSNALLAQRVSFINFLSQIAHWTKADIRDVRRGIGSDKRIGMQFLFPSPGFGGSCFPKDVSALGYQARKAGVSPIMMDATMQMNQMQKEFVRDLVLAKKPSAVAVWGLAFKARTDDVRDSASIFLVKELLANDVRVLVHDPQAMKNFLKVVPDAVFGGKNTILESVDVLVIMTEWDEYRTIDDEQLNLLRDKVIIDARNILARPVEQEKFRTNNITYIGLGVHQSVD